MYATQLHKEKKEKRTSDIKIFDAQLSDVFRIPYTLIRNTKDPGTSIEPETLIELENLTVTEQVISNVLMPTTTTNPTQNTITSNGKGE